MSSSVKWGIEITHGRRQACADRGVFPPPCLPLCTYHEKPLVGIDDAEPDGHVGVLTVLQEGADGDIPSCWVRLCREKTETQGWHWAPFQQPGPCLTALSPPPMSHSQCRCPGGLSNPTSVFLPLCPHGAPMGLRPQLALTAFCLLIMIQPCAQAICILETELLSYNRDWGILCP